MKQAIYFVDHGKSREQPYLVLKENANGTVNLGTEEGVVVISQCPVSEQAKVGHCVIQPDAPVVTKPAKPSPASAAKSAPANAPAKKADAPVPPKPAEAPAPAEVAKLVDVPAMGDASAS